jgi:hypothetical protein
VYLGPCTKLPKKKNTPPKNPPDPLGDAGEVILSRQALHAHRIRLAHPATGQPIEFTAPLPADLAAVLAELRLAKSNKRQ